VILETSEERVKLIKAGYNQKEIREIYLAEHNFTKSLHPFLLEIVELDLTNEAPHSRDVGYLMSHATEVVLTIACPNLSRAAEYND